MRRHIASIVTLFHLFGAIGVPVVAYSCDESGEAGVVSVLSVSDRACYVDSCCDRDEAQAQTRVYDQSDVPCCALEIHAATLDGRTLLPGQKYGQANSLEDTPVRFDASRPGVRIASSSLSISAFHAAINLPLLI